MTKRVAPVLAKPVPPNVMSITAFFHCTLCVRDRPEHLSPQDYSRLDVGSTELGWQVWCRRHNCNVIHISFEGHKHMANTQRSKE